MRSFKRGFFLIAGLLLMSIISSCGGASGNTLIGRSPTSPPQRTPTASATRSGVVKILLLMADDKTRILLTDANGMTLYYFQPDTASKAACTGSCAQTWPPLLFTGTGSPTLEGEIQGTINGKQVTYNGATLSRELEVHPNANGKQVTYNGHPLYTYSGDTGPSQTRGDGFAGKWSVVPPDIAKNAP